MSNLLERAETAYARRRDQESRQVNIDRRKQQRKQERKHKKLLRSRRKTERQALAFVRSRLGVEASDAHWKTFYRGITNGHKVYREQLVMQLPDIAYIATWVSPISFRKKIVIREKGDLRLICPACWATAEQQAQKNQIAVAPEPPVRCLADLYGALETLRMHAQVTTHTPQFKSA